MADLVDQPPQLRQFLRALPKGGDLHHHLDGAVYAEHLLRWADADQACIDKADHRAHPGPCDADTDEPARGLASRAPAFYNETVDAMSMRDFVPGDGADSGHDQFFDTFGRFAAISARHRTDMLALVLQQAAAEHVRYIETMTDPAALGTLAPLVTDMPWQTGAYDKALAHIQDGIGQRVAAARQAFDDDIDRLDQRLGCDTPDAQPACDVAYRFQFYVLRTLPPEKVFAQMALGFALAAADPRVVAVNIVAPEDNPTARADYRQHMAMFAFFHRRYPDVALSLHAGELTPGLVPPADLRFHIAAALAAGADRIGHGVDIASEDDAAATLARMRNQPVAVEINLTSNDVILGVAGAEHPLNLYRRAGVPVVLSTDDPGVSRIDLTHEYERAVREQGLDYRALKQLSRNSLIYAFLPGPSLWQPKAPRRAVPACAQALEAQRMDARCRRFIKASDKARSQWQLEQDFHRFEHRVTTGRS
ncbi:adenosine deaminase [Salinisphaera sp. Q1T1-3]|nr:adenosine deaminase [Salinisphaera sp. Q1T1-3]